MSKKTEQKKKSKSPKIKPEKVDGLGPKEIRMIRIKLRQIWQWCHARQIVIKRATDSEGFPFCENCFQRVPAHKIDHVGKVGDVDRGFIERLFCPSTGLQALCKTCHDEKTKRERAEDRKGRRRPPR